MLTMTVYGKEIEADGQHDNCDDDGGDDVNYIRHYLIYESMGRGGVRKKKISQSAGVLFGLVVGEQQPAVFEVVEPSSLLRDVVPLSLVQSLGLLSSLPQVVGEGLAEMRVREVDDHLVPPLRLLALLDSLFGPFAGYQLYEV